MGPQDRIVLAILDSRFSYMAICNQIHKSKVLATSFICIKNEETGSLRYLRSIFPQKRYTHKANGLLKDRRHTSWPRGGRRLRLLSDGLRGSLGGDEGRHLAKAQN